MNSQGFIVNIECSRIQNVSENLFNVHPLYIKYIDCMSVCLCPINVKTTELIGPKFCEGPHITPVKIYY